MDLFFEAACMTKCVIITWFISVAHTHQEVSASGGDNHKMECMMSANKGRAKPIGWEM